MQLKNYYNVKIFRLGWLKHFPASAQLNSARFQLKRFSTELLRLRVWRPGLITMSVFFTWRSQDFCSVVA